jgi:anti-sigma regulatory factor (Ser/Thr protein kinase)
VTSETFTGEVRSVRLARRFVAEHVNAVDIDTDLAVLLTSELASNVVKHACTNFDVVVCVDSDRVRVEIHDGMAVTEAFRDLIKRPPLEIEASASGGRGLLLLGSTVNRFGLTEKPSGGKAIWFEMDRVQAAGSNGTRRERRVQEGEIVSPRAPGAERAQNASRPD